MSDLIRFGVSLEKGLLEVFDKNIKKRKYTNRSEAIRDLIRKEIVKEQWTHESDIAGAVIIIYDHHKRDLVEKLMKIQHDFHRIIISTQHIHLDHDNCLEIIAVKGKTKNVQELTDKLTASKGVKHSSLSMSSTGKGLL